MYTIAKVMDNLAFDNFQMITIFTPVLIYGYFFLRNGAILFIIPKNYYFGFKLLIFQNGN